MRAAALLCLLVVLAGCADPGVGGRATPTPDRGSDPTPTATPDARSTPTPEGRATSARPTPDGGTADETDGGTVTDAPAVSNPWNADPVTVGIEVPDGDDRDYRPLVRAALDFWENESVRYDFDYRITDDPDPDVRIEFVANVSVCGREHNALDI